MIKLPTIDPFKVEKEIISFLQSKVLEMRKDGIIIGVSGGVDSAVCSILSKKAMDYIEKETFGVILPGSTSNACINDNQHAVALCNKFNLPYHVVFLDNLIYNSNNLLSSSFNLDKVTVGNMSSRIRSNMLHTVAESKNWLVCGTGNRDEDYGVGYYTLFGDGAVHMSPIGNLSKRLVYVMAKHLGVIQEIIEKEPSARLEEDQTDSHDLGYGYDVVEVFSEGMSQGISIPNILKELIKLNYNKIMHPSVESLFADLSHRHQSAIKKAQLVSPDIAYVSLIYK